MNNPNFKLGVLWAVLAGVNISTCIISSIEFVQSDNHIRLTAAILSGISSVLSFLLSALYFSNSNPK